METRPVPGGHHGGPVRPGGPGVAGAHGGQEEGPGSPRPPFWHFAPASYPPELVLVPHFPDFAAQTQCSCQNNPVLFHVVILVFATP